MKEEIEKILARLAPTAEESSHITGSEPFYAIKESDLPEFIDQILTLLDKEVRKAVEFTLEATYSIEYPPSGKEWHFQDNEWRNSLSMATEYVLEQLEEGK